MAAEEGSCEFGFVLAYYDVPRTVLISVIIARNPKAPVERDQVIRENPTDTPESGFIAAVYVCVALFGVHVVVVDTVLLDLRGVVPPGENGSIIAESTLG